MRKLFIFFCLLSSAANSQNYGYFAGGRSAALSHSSVALTDVWSSFHNQAGLAYLEKPALALGYENRFFLQELSLGHVAIAHPFSFGTVGINFNYFGFELYNESKFGLTYARAFGKYFSLGLQLNYHNFFVSEGTDNPGAVTFEAGVIAKPNSKLHIGFHVFNPSNNYKNSDTGERLPVIGRLGAQYRFNEEVALTAEVRRNDQFSERYAAGFEYRLVKALTLRAGSAIQPLANTFGIGLNFSGFSADLAYEYTYTLGNNANFSLQYNF